MIVLKTLRVSADTHRRAKMLASATGVPTRIAVDRALVGAMDALGLTMPDADTDHGAVAGTPRADRARDAQP